MEPAERLRAYRERVEVALGRWLPPATTHPERLHAAIRYSIMGEHRRLRPMLIYACGECIGVPASRLDAIAVAIEIVHACSQVHDALPALHDSSLRRGRPATHVSFDEATAILVGDALQAHAYLVLATDAGLATDASERRQLVLDLAAASGPAGLTGGQAMEASAATGPTTAELAERILRFRTGRLVEAALAMPCRLLGREGARERDDLERFGRAFGLALGIVGELEAAADPAPSPRRAGPSLLALLGGDAAGRRVEALRAEAVSALSARGAGAALLLWLCDQALPAPAGRSAAAS